jgi:hypothetical protein
VVAQAQLEDALEPYAVLATDQSVSGLTKGVARSNWRRSIERPDPAPDRQRAAVCHRGDEPAGR